jgi:hypothetical protein
LRPVRVVRTNSAVLWSEAEGEGDIEFFEGFHLAIKPGIGVWTEGGEYQ